MLIFIKLYAYIPLLFIYKIYRTIISLQYWKLFQQIFIVSFDVTKKSIHIKITTWKYRSNKLFDRMLGVLIFFGSIFKLQKYLFLKAPLKYMEIFKT